MVRIGGIVRTMLGVLLLAMVVVNVANAAGRYLLGAALPGSDEILVFAMVWLVFLGACVVSLQDRHLSFDLLAKACGTRLSQALSALTHLVIAGLCAFVALQSWAVLKTLTRVGQKSMATEIPMAIPHAAVLVSFALMAAIALYRAVRPAVRPGEKSAELGSEDRS